MSGAPYWFLQVAPRLVLDDGRHVTLGVESMFPHGGYFRMPGEPEASGLELGGHVTVEFEKPDTGTLVAIKSAVTRLRGVNDGAGPETSLGLTYVALSRHLSGRSAVHDGPSIACPTDYPPLAWGNHPFFVNHRLRFFVTHFFKGGMTLSFQRDVKGVIESQPLDLVLILPGLESLGARVRVAGVELSESDAWGRCSVVFEAPAPELLQKISRYLFSALPSLSPDASIGELERLGYPLPGLEYSAVFSIAHTPEEIRDMLALRLSAYKHRPGANLDGVDEPEGMRDRFDAHSLILQMRAGNKAVGTGRVVFNDGDPAKSEIAQFAKLPGWLWAGGFVECSRLATVPGIRGRDVFSTISRHAVRIAHQSGASYMVADCEDNLLDPYKRRGAKELGVRFTHPLEGVTLNVLYYDLAELLAADGGDRRFWAPTWDRT